MTASAVVRPPKTVAQAMISVVIPVRNEQSCIAHTLDGVLAQNYPIGCFEVLVVDNQSTDRTREIIAQYAERHAHVRLLCNDKHWSSSGRNVGVKNARGDYVIIVDGHCELKDRDYLKNLADAFHRSGADCIGRPQPLRIAGASALQRAIAAARTSRLGHHPDSYIYATGEQMVPAHSVAAAYRRCVFEEIGLFDETFDACEDVELNHRVDEAGLSCFFTDKIELPYIPRNSLFSLFKQLCRYGRGRIRLLRKHPNTFTWKSFLPALFVLAIFVGILLIPFSTLFAWIYLSTLAAYSVIVVISAVTLSTCRRDVGILPWLPIVYATIHASAGIGISLEMVLGTEHAQKTTEVNAE